ncbi:hypothetical protein L8P40_03830 [Enterobacter kobei]|uniref:hypothetical protein n=1 Tax=Enterobacter TaxID=547 RepID=UPI0020060DA0|nr:hypothetical protein [Enterobacter kobei]MCK7240219.1 hypothetical protein [Enterobacter kobei]
MSTVIISHNELALAELKDQLLELNYGPDIPFNVVAEGDELVASWKIADAQWIKIFGTAGLKEQYELRLFFNVADKQVSYSEKSMDLAWNADLETFNFNKTVKYGSRREFACETSWGIREDGSFGKLYSYNFSTNFIKKPVFDIIANAGWDLQLSITDRYGTRVIWGIIILFVLSGLTIYMF